MRICEHIQQRGCHLVIWAVVIIKCMYAKTDMLCFQMDQGVLVYLSELSVCEQKEAFASCKLFL